MSLIDAGDAGASCIGDGGRIVTRYWAVACPECTVHGGAGCPVLWTAGPTCW